MPNDDASLTDFARTFTDFVETMAAAGRRPATDLTRLGTRVRDFLGVDLTTIDPVTEAFPPHQSVDLDLALSTIIAEHGELIGVLGANRLHMDAFGDFLQNAHSDFEPGPVSYVRLATGPDTTRRIVAFGVGLARIDGVPIAWLQRSASPHYGRESYTVEILCPRTEVVEALTERIRSLMYELSVLRGQVISFQGNDFDYSARSSGVAFLRRPEVSADDVVLPDGVLDRITRHVVQIGRHRDALSKAGQHLKRGVLLYGPPGTGKTHVVRHLLTLTPGTTAVLLSGRMLGALNEATKLARVMQPAIVVLEDCDLIAEERGGDTNSMLFEMLEAMDGLDGDADVTFLLTTNRPDLLERALTERPGRVDLAVAIDRPDLAGRRRLFALYARNTALSSAALDAAAARTEGITASFTKEAVRRAVVAAAIADRPLADGDLHDALDQMLSDAETFTASLLGAAQPDITDGEFMAPAEADPEDQPSPSMGWFAYPPGSHPRPRPGRWLPPRYRG